jgi:hypothetical protein
MQQKRNPGAKGMARGAGVFDQAAQQVNARLTPLAHHLQTNAAAPRGWRDRLPVHPAAELFPLMSDGELRELADDICRHGLREPVALFHDDRTETFCLLDGRNRLDALQFLGRDVFEHDEPRWGYAPDPAVFRTVDLDADPAAYVLSLNIRRRHLDAEQRRELLAKLLKADPEKSNRQIAKTVGVDDKTVASVRRDLESTAAIPQLEKTTGRDGKARPARKKKQAERTLADFKGGVENGIGAIEFCVDTWLAELSADDVRQARDYVIARLDAVIAALRDER